MWLLLSIMLLGRSYSRATIYPVEKSALVLNPTWRYRANRANVANSILLVSVGTLWIRLH